MDQSPYKDDRDVITADTRLIRRINHHFCDWNSLDSEGNPRVTSQAAQFYTQDMAEEFGCPGPALSVIVEVLADPIHVLTHRYAGDGLAYLDANMVRGGGERGIQIWPTNEEPAHAVVFRTDGGKDLSRSVKRQFAKHLSTNWIVTPVRS